MFQPESSLGKVSSPQLAALDKLPLPTDVTQLAETALALALEEHRSYKEAAQLLGDVLSSEHLVKASLGRWALHFERGYVLILSGNKAEAVTEFKEAIRLKPDYAKAHNNLGVALAQQGQRAAAAAEYKEAIRLKPDLARRLPQHRKQRLQG